MVGNKRLVPEQPKIYHIVHVGRLPSIIKAGCLWSDSEAIRRGVPGVAIANKEIKERRRVNELRSAPGLRVGECVPFYFCPRSPMLYAIHTNDGDDPDFPYTGGQEPVVHLEADLKEAVKWGDANQQRWAFTLSNAGAREFEDYCDLGQLDKIDWAAVRAKYWQGRSSQKQAEFLIEGSFPWELVASIGVYSWDVRVRVLEAVRQARHKPVVSVQPRWYY